MDKFVYRHKVTGLYLSYQYRDDCELEKAKIWNSRPFTLGNYDILSYSDIRRMKLEKINESRR